MKIHKSRDFNEKYQLSREEESKLLNSRLDTLDRRKRKLIREKTLLDNRAKLTIDERERLLNILRLIQDIDNEVNSIYNGDDNSDS
jgi:DNA-directed RNA polymerase sigma subunit (sigma70/sigma32)